jgi:dTDP-4-amino-4,6-dideoxygalactose transaminase
MRQGWVSQGKVTEEFESALAKYCGAAYATVVNNGSSALMCALMAHGAKTGDLVVLPDYTHIATANIPKLLGCRVSLVDIDPETLNVDCEALERVIRRHRPKFVVVVDVAGLPNDMEFLSDLARRYRFTLIEDAAESIGAEYKHRRVGSHGHTATLSFHAAKQLTTVEGGAILTDDHRIAKRCRMIRNHGEDPSSKYVSTLAGGNFRTTDIQSAIGIVQLRKLDAYLSRRKQILQLYRERLSGLLGFQVVPRHVTKHGCMMTIALTSSGTIRHDLEQHLNQHEIETRRPWPPIHRQSQFRSAGDTFPNSSHAYKSVISLPLYNAMKDAEVETVVSSVLTFESDRCAKGAQTR